MERKNIYYILTGILFLVLYACPESNNHFDVFFMNKSNEKIYLYKLSDPVKNEADTLWECGVIGKELVIDEKYRLGTLFNSWEDYFSSQSSLQLIILSEFFSDWDIDNCSEEKIRDFSQKHQLHRYQLTLEDLKRMNWTVVYPPEE